MGKIGREVDDLKRLDEIIHLLADEEMGLILDRLDLKHRLPFTKRFKTRKKKPKPERLREVLEELGPTFVKFGQIMAQRPDIVPKRYIEELQGLEDHVPPFDSDKSVEIIEEELGEIDEIFEDFEHEPMAAASIAQVHKATLTSGEEVIVKVRRPGITETVETDVDIINFMAKRAENLSDSMKDLRLVDLVKEFEKWIKEEMDLRKEGRNAEVMKSNMEDMDKIKIPEVYNELTTSKVLVMEYVDGVKCTEEGKLEELDIDISRVTRTGIEMGLNQVVRDGFFHADPHPSNFFIDENGNIILIDFGMVGKLTKKTRQQLGLLFLHIGNEDVDSAVDVIKELGHVSQDADIDGFKQDVEEMMLTLRNSRVKDNTLSSTMLEIVISASGKGIYLPTNLVLTGKTLVTLEGILLTVNPEAKLTTEYKDQIESILKEQNSPKQLAKDFMIDFYQNKELLTKAPSKISSLMEKEQTTETEEHYSRDHEEILVTGLILSAVFLFSQTLPTGSLQLLASALMIAAFWIIHTKF